MAPVKLELEAYETGRRELLVQLVLMDKWTPSEQAARDLVDEVLALPYHTELREHYR